MSVAPSWLREVDGGFRLSLVIQTNAKQNAVVGVFDGRLKVKIASLPVDGAANKEIIRYFSKLLSVPKNRISIIQGELNKRKVIEIQAVFCIENMIKQLTENWIDA